MEPATTPGGIPNAPTTAQQQPPYLLTTTLSPAASSSSSSKTTFDDATEYANLTYFDKSLLRTTESTWEPVDQPALRFGMLPSSMRRGRPKCCRRVRENEKKEARKMKCRNGSIFQRDARGRRRRKCRRRNRCKRRCKQHYKNTAWSIVGTMMKGLDFFIPKLEFKFHTGTLVFGTKFFSGLVPFIQAKLQAMQFFYSMFEPLLDGVLDALDFGRIGFRSMDLLDDDDDGEDEKKRKKHEVIAHEDNAVIVDEKNDAEKVEDYDDSDIVPDLLLAKNDLQSLPEDGDEEEDDEGYESPKDDEPVDEDYGIDEDWDSDDDDEDNVEEDDNEEEEEEEEVDNDFQKRITLPKPPKIIKRPLNVRPRPSRKPLLHSRITPPTPLGGQQQQQHSSDPAVVQEFMNRIKDDDLNFTVYHSNIAGSHKQKPKPLDGSNAAHNRLPFNDTHVLNVDNLVLNINSKPAEALYEDDVEYQEDPAEDLDDDKLIDIPRPYRRVKSRPPVFSSFTAFFGAISDAFDSYFSGTY